MIGVIDKKRQGHALCGGNVATKRQRSVWVEHPRPACMNLWGICPNNIARLEGAPGISDESSY